MRAWSHATGNLCWHTDRALSWVYFLFAVAYASVRCALWIRGRLALRRAAADLPSPPPPMAVPDHLTQALTGLFQTTDGLACDAVAELRAVDEVLISDPDVPMGHVRDRRYVRAVIRSWNAARRWLREIEELPESDQQRLRDLGLDAGRTERLLEELRPSWRHAARSRPLEPIPIEEARLSRDLIAHLADEMRSVTLALASGDAHPYRGMGGAGLQPSRMSFA